MELKRSDQGEYTVSSRGRRRAAIVSGIVLLLLIVGFLIIYSVRLARQDFENTPRASGEQEEQGSIALVGVAR